ncbi:MAG: hypothetical protein ACOXZS_04420 [Bacilli bacterium]
MLRMKSTGGHHPSAYYIYAHNVERDPTGIASKIRTEVVKGYNTSLPSFDKEKWYSRSQVPFISNTGEMKYICKW